MEPEMPADRRMVDAGALEDGRAAQGAGREHDLWRVHHNAPDLRVGRIAIRGDRHVAERIGGQEAAIDAHRPAVLDENASNAHPVDDAGPVLRRGPEMDSDPGPLRADHAAERAGAADAAIGGVAADAISLPAEGASATKEELVLRRGERRRRDAELGLNDGEVSRPPP